MIDSNEAIELLDYSLSRFELHIDTQFGDGEWNNSLDSSNVVFKNFAGFIWSALGSPNSEDRWNAAHSVRMLANFNNIEIIDELTIFLKNNSVGAFGSCKFEFYNLHARLYLFIALARISLDKPELLTKQKDLFVYYAFEEQHILIQKFSADIALNLSNSFKDIYDLQTIEKLKTVGKSLLPKLDLEYNETIDSYWHVNKVDEIKFKYHFGWDFDRYWFEPLGRVFGIKEKQVEDIAADIIINDWGIKEKNGFLNDSRYSLWDNHNYRNKTQHSHGNYPMIDDYDFYIAYHSLMVSAAKLLEKMPVVKRKGWYDDEWNQWLSDHLLTCNNNRWLSDYRDPVPFKRPEWVSIKNRENFITNITDNSFFNALVIDNDFEKWVNVKGTWEESNQEYKESYYISSALVSKKYSDALMHALETCSDPYDYKLPSYKDKDFEINIDNFILKGWINEDNISAKLDNYDPYANNINFTHYEVGKEIMDKFKLHLKNNGKTWYLPHSTSPVIECKIWSSYKGGMIETPNQYGKCIRASLQFLKQLSSTLNLNIIFEVSIQREIYYKYKREKNKIESSKYIHKIFILTSNGELKSKEKNYKLR